MNATIGAAIEHPVGPTGTVRIGTTDARLTVRAVDGDQVRFWAADGRDLDPHYRWHLGDGLVEIEPRERGAFGFGRLFGDRLPDIVAEVPHDGHLRLETVSGAIHVVGARGPQEYRLVSGAFEALGVAGRIRVDGVSGAIRLEADERAAVRARTVSGQVDIAGPRFDSLEVRFMSGSIDVRGRLDGSGPFAFDGVAGSVSLAVDGPIRVEGTTVSGSIATDLPHRTGGGPGRRTIEIGGGGPLVTFKTVSGNLRVVRRDRSGASNGDEMADQAAGPAEQAGGARAADPDAAARLAILRDLEAGRIDIDAATRLLANLDGSDRGSAAGDVARTADETALAEPETVLEASGTPAAAGTAAAPAGSKPAADGGTGTATAGQTEDGSAERYWDHRA
jgi:hypothetical protein